MEIVSQDARQSVEEATWISNATVFKHHHALRNEYRDDVFKLLCQFQILCVVLNKLQFVLSALTIIVILEVPIKHKSVRTHRIQGCIVLDTFVEFVL